MDETSVSLRDRLIEAAAKAAWRRDYVGMPSDWYETHQPEKFHRALAERMVDAVLPLLADEIEHMPIRYSKDQRRMADRHEVTVDAAELVRSAAGVL